MKTYYKTDKTIDIKGMLDEDENGEKFISYMNGEDTENIQVNDLLDMMLGGYVQFKTISD